jgi:alpha-mannosidase
MYLKLENDKAQKAICLYAEPLSSIAWAIGNDFPQSTLDKSWELILRNHPHDSICGCSVDDVHSDMEDRFRDVHFLTDDLIEHSLRQIVSTVDTGTLAEKNFIVFNTAPYSRDAVVSIQGKSKLITAIPALGYTAIREGKKSLPASMSVKITERTLSNRFVEVHINNDGTLDIKDLENGHCFSNLGRLEDAGDAGDEYNYSYPTNDRIYSSTDCNPSITILRQQEALVEAAIEYDMELPEKLTSDRLQRGTSLRKMPVRTRVILKAESPVVEIKTTIKNTVRDHIVRVLFPSKIEAKTTFAGSPFDVVEHPIHINDYDESMIPEKVRKVIVGAREAKPNTIFLGQEFVDINDREKGIAILSRGLPEYTVYEKDNTIALTLFRSIGWVAKEINTRIGDAGPEIFTPQAQCLRQMEFEYAIYPHRGDYEQGNVVRQADSFNNKISVIETDRHEGSLPLDTSFLSVKDTFNMVRISSVNKGKNGNHIIIRLYNLGTKPTKVIITSPLLFTSAERTDFREERKASLKISKEAQDSCSLSFEIGTKAIETIKITLDRVSQGIDKPKNVPCWLFGEEEPENLEKYEAYPLVLESEVQMELERAERLKPGLHAPLTRRTALEAQLSAILAQNRLNEVNTRELGYQLNEARVERRVHDYIKDALKK